MYDVPRTEELFATAAFFDDLNQSWPQLFDRRDVVRKDTHLPRLCRYVYLDTADSFLSEWSTVYHGRRWPTYTSVDLYIL